MKAPRPLKDLPGFDEKLDEAIAAKPWLNYPDMWEALPNVVIPGVDRILSSNTLWELALIIDAERWAARRRLRLVPPPLPVAANDCEPTNG